MDLPLSPKSPRSPKRQLTLGPTAPIQDWEVERATLLKNYKESHEKAERLEKLLQEEQTIFEKNTSSLLREVKLKEAHLEKKLKDVENTLMEQVLQLEQRLEDTRTEHFDQIKSLKSAHAQALDTEDKKYQRRLLGLQERLKAKDKDYADLLEQNSTDEEKDKLIISLKFKLAEVEKESMSKTVEELRIRESEQDSALTKRIKELEKQVTHYKKRLDQASAGYSSQIQGLTEKLISEAKQTEMIHQARIQNLQTEHDDTSRELREQHQTEKEVWSIEKDAAVDKVRYELGLEKEEAIEKLNNEWKEKYDDLNASMSKDSMAIQLHWEKKKEESQSHYSAKLDRLMGEMEVVKQRLGKEIERRKYSEGILTDCLNQKATLQSRLGIFQTHVKRRVGTENEVHKLRHTYQASSRLAKEVLAVLSPKTLNSQEMNLEDMLQSILRNTLIADTHRDCCENMVF